jgi:HEAT repeat protein
VTSRTFLLVVALAQGALLAALVVLIILNRWIRLRRRAQVHPRRVRVDAAMQQWAAGAEETRSVLSRLGEVPVPLAIDALVHWSARVPGDRWRTLADALQHQWWARLVRANSASARWWKRLEAARFLSVAATPPDTARVLRLLRDQHAAVHIAAVAALERLDSPALVTAALERLPRLVPTVQAYYASMLRRARPVVVRLLLKLLGRRQDAALARLAEFAVRLEEPALREPLTALANHPDPEVRAQATRALGSYPHAASIAALTRLAADPAWPVRAQAMRSLGRIADPRTLPLVREALKDGESWVRLRAALALMRFGPEGRNVMLAAEVGAEPGARNVARLVLGLSPQALMEFAA